MVPLILSVFYEIKVKECIQGHMLNVYLNQVAADRLCTVRILWRRDKTWHSSLYHIVKGAYTCLAN